MLTKRAQLKEEELEKVIGGTQVEPIKKEDNGIPRGGKLGVRVRVRVK